MHFVYPTDLMEPRYVEEVFRDEADALRNDAHDISIVNTDLLAGGSARVVPSPEAGQTVVYRGWMLTPQDYQNFVALLVNGYVKNVVPLTSAEQYVNAHYLPRWVSLLADLTPETVIVDFATQAASDADLQQILRALNWPAYFVKDFVKSHKTGRGSIIHQSDELPALLDEMRAYRGELEGGVCFRRVEHFVPDSEKRYFVLRGTPFGADANAAVPEVVLQCAQWIDSPFFSVDVALRADGVLRVVEIGDGQVSDLVGWTPAQFASIWRHTGA